MAKKKTKTKKAPFVITEDDLKKISAQFTPANTNPRLGKPLQITYRDGSQRTVYLDAENVLFQLALHPSKSEAEKKAAFLQQFPGEEQFYEDKLKEMKPALDMLGGMIKMFGGK